MTINISSLPSINQDIIASKFLLIAKLVKSLSKSKGQLLSLCYANVSRPIIDRMSEKEYIIVEDNLISCELDEIKASGSAKSDAHYVKNIRGAILLSLVQDLLNIERLTGKFSIYSEQSPLLLHSASELLCNEDNAKMMWRVLKNWDDGLDENNKNKINYEIHKSLKMREDFFNLSNGLIRSFSETDNLGYLVSKIKDKTDFPKDIYQFNECLVAWLVDDEQANGWKNLISSIVSNFKIIGFNGLEDIKIQMGVFEKTGYSIVPDLALVDLRLSETGSDFSQYNPKDLSGFEVIELFMKQFSGLSVMVASASSRLWNMEKAIQKGASSYWRKSDEVYELEVFDAVFTSFDVHNQLLNKISISLKKTKLKYIFRLVDSIHASVSKFNKEKYNSLIRSVSNYAYDLDNKTSWICWHDADETRAHDSIFLGVMEIFNELEPLLWNKGNESLNFDLNVKIRKNSGKSDILVINKSLEFIDRKYDIGGVSFESSYESCKAIRNKLPTIHGSEYSNDIKHAGLQDIEVSLLIIWILVNELLSFEGIS